jgi:hypothetical protein
MMSGSCVVIVLARKKMPHFCFVHQKLHMGYLTTDPRFSVVRTQ